MTSAVQRELQELRVAAESYGVRHVHLEHFAYPRGVCMAVNLTVDFDAMLLRRVHNEPPMQLAKGEFGGRVIAHESHNSATPPTIAIILQLTKLFLLGYNNGYYPYDLDLDESRYENLYINSMFITIRERLQEIMLHFFELYQRERSNYVSDEIESTLRFMTESIFSF